MDTLLIDHRYRPEKLLGSGGMAEVYLAHDDVLDREVALKVLSSRYADNANFIRRFEREARSAAALSHPSIVSIYDRGESKNGTCYIAMEYLPGGTLKDYITKRGPLPPHTAAVVASQIARALQAAHHSGVIHRDIKPHNILITASGDVKVADFGIARAGHDAAYSGEALTGTGTVLGTAQYMAPEQAMGQPVGPASDLYSLGVVLYEMLTGELPYSADTPIGMAMQHVSAPLRPPRQTNPEIPEALDALTCRLLAKDPAHRYPDAGEVLADLRRVRQSSATTAIPEATPAKPTRTTQRIKPAPSAEKTRAGEPSEPQPPTKEKRSQRRSQGRWERRAARVALRISISVLFLAALSVPAEGGLGYGPLKGLDDEVLPSVETPFFSAPPEAPPATAEVPDLTGLTLEQARGEVAEDFEVSQREPRPSPQPAGTILEQTPPASSGRAPKGSGISVTLSEGPETDALPSPDASAPPQPEHDPSSLQSVRQTQSSPPQGGRLPSAQGSDDASPSLVEAPDLSGATLLQARAMLAAEGLVLGAQHSQPVAEVPAGHIFEQDPPPGGRVEPGGAVDVSLAAEPSPQVEVPEARLAKPPAKPGSPPQLRPGEASEAGEASTEAQLPSNHSSQPASRKTQPPDSNLTAQPARPDGRAGSDKLVDELLDDLEDVDIEVEEN